MASRMQIKRAPTHPGAILREDVLPAVGMSITGVAKALGVSRQQLHRIMAETAPVTPEMALRLGKFCGNGPDLWLRMQAAYDLWRARLDHGQTIERISTVRQMIMRPRHELGARRTVMVARRQRNAG
jgi:addiction module HigA family antidote